LLPASVALSGVEGVETVGGVVSYSQKMIFRSCLFRDGFFFSLTLTLSRWERVRVRDEGEKILKM
jgi:hypothetical protein